MAIGMDITRTAIIEIRMLDHVSGELGGLGKRIADVGATISQVGLGLTAAFTVPILGAAATATKLAVDFDRAMRSVQAVAGTTDASTAVLGESIKQLSMDITKTAESPTRLAAGMYEIVSAGFRGGDALKVLEASSKGATATLADSKDTAIALSTALNAYSAGADQAARFTDIMVKAVDLGVFHMSDLVQQMGDFTSTAAMIGVDFGEAMAWFTNPTRMGLPAAESATGTMRILRDILKPSPKQAKAWTELGIDLTPEAVQADGFLNKMNELYTRMGMVTVIEQKERDERLKSVNAQITETQNRIRAASATNASSAALRTHLADLKAERDQIKAMSFDVEDYDTVMQKMAERAKVPSSVIAAAFPDIRALKTFIANYADGGKMLMDTNNQISNSAGTTQKHFDDMSKSFAVQFDNLKNMAQVAGIAVGDGLAPLMLRLGEAIKPVLNNFINLTPEMKAQYIQWGLLAAVIGPVMIGLGMVITFMAQFGSLIGGLGKAIGTLISGAFSPLGLSIIGLIAAVIILTNVWNSNWMNIRGVTAKVAKDIQTDIGNIKSALQDLTGLSWGEITRYFKEGIGDLGTQLKNAVGGASELEKAQSELAQIQRNLADPNFFKYGWGGTQENTDFKRQLQEREIWLKTYIRDVQNAMEEFQRLTKDMELIQSPISSDELAARLGGRNPKEVFDRYRYIESFLGNALGTEGLNKLIRQGAETGQQIGSGVVDAGNQELLAGKIDWAATGQELLTGLLGALEAGAPAVLGFLGNFRQQMSAALGIDKLYSSGPLSKLTAAERFRAGLPEEEAAGYEDPLGVFTGTQKAMEGLKGWWDELMANHEPIDSGAQYFDSAMGDSADKLKTRVTDAINEGIDASKKLGDLSGGTYGGGPLAPGAGGPFEDMYRIQDIAQNLKEHPGKETEKWWKMYAPGMSREDASAWAKDIIKKFQLGLWEDPAVAQILGPDFIDKMANVVVMESMATATLDRYAEAITKAAVAKGADPKAAGAVLATMGMGPDITSKDLLPSATNLVTNLKPALDQAALGAADGKAMQYLIAGDPSKPASLPQIVPTIIANFNQDVAANAGPLQEAGAAAWNQIGIGMVNRARSDGTLYRAVEAMVYAVLGGEK